MSRRRYTRPPATTGWVVVEDMTHKRLSVEDCSSGGAQEAFERKCQELAKEGWELEERSFDSRFANRGSERVFIAIRPTDPSKPLARHSTWS